MLSSPPIVTLNKGVILFANKTMLPVFLRFSKQGVALVLIVALVVV